MIIRHCECSEAIQQGHVYGLMVLLSRRRSMLDCRVANAPRNDGEEGI